MLIYNRYVILQFSDPLPVDCVHCLFRVKDFFKFQQAAYKSTIAGLH